MLLAVQTKGTHSGRLQKAGEEILFAVRQRRSADSGVSPTAGKRTAGRAIKECNSALIIHKPRPHIMVTINKTPIEALLDSGSETSFINMDTTRQEKLRINREFSEIRLANGTTVTTDGTVDTTITVTGRPHNCRLHVLDGMKSNILIGTDLWADLQITIPPPPKTTNETGRNINVIETGLTPRTPKEDERLQKFLKTELDLFDKVQGPTNLIQHHIRLTDTKPIKQRYTPRNPAMQEVINKEVEEMLEKGTIEPSKSAWSSPVVLVKKKDGSRRFCIDFRKLNSVTEKDAYPLPHITATLDKLRGAKYLSTLDLKNGYWQIPLTYASRPLTAFTVPGKGLMQFKVMPFGLHSAPATFQRLLDRILGPELEPHVLVYLDDIIIASQTFEDHLRHLKEVFRRLRQARLKLNTEKCRFCVPQLGYLGHIVDREGIRTNPEKVSAIINWPVPTTMKKVRQFVGLASWYRRFTPNFAKITAPLTKLMRKNAKWKWGEEENTAFSEVKRLLTTAPVLACPDFREKFTIQTDASTEGLGVVLTQNLEGSERVIAYASRTLNNAEKNYSATELECLAVVWGIKKLRGYLEGYKFTVITDHQALKWLKNIDTPSGRLARWVIELQQYDFDIQYRRGSLNTVADALSRQPEAATVSDPTTCGWYTKMKARVAADPDAWPDYKIEDDHLKRYILHSLEFSEVQPDSQWKLCVPRNSRNEVMRQNHDAPTAGHLGIAKTITRIARTYYWPGMFRDIAKYVRACRSCMAQKAHQAKPAGQMHATAVKGPWQQVTMDLIGPLPRSTKGNAWILTMQDRFTKWLEMRPIRRATAHIVTENVAKNILYRYGCPQTIISDNSTQLKSRQLGQLLGTFGIKHQTTPVHAPHCNPVERTNRVVKTMVAQYVGRNQRRWDENLDALQFAYNTAVQSSTGYSPAYLNYGREVGTLPEHTQGDKPDTHRRKLEEANELVKINLARAFQRQEKYYNLRRRNWKPQIGERVWKKTYTLSNKAKAINAKLSPRYTGPMEVRKIISPVIVDLKDSSGKWHRHIHVQDLKPDASTDDDLDVENDI